MKIAGAWSGHDCSFCLFEDGKPLVHAEYERYIREKEPAGDGIQFMFDELDPEEYSDIKHFGTCHPLDKLENHSDSYKELMNILKKNDGEFHVIGHHHAHAANAFFSSNFDESLIVTMDGGGVEDANRYPSAFTVWTGKGNKIKHVKTFPLGEVNIGGVWTRVTRYVFNMQSGWPTGHQAGTIMAMAAFGDPQRFHNDFLTMLIRDSAAVSYKPPGQPRGANVGTDPNHPYLHRWREIADQDEQNKFDLAAGLQSATEFYMKNIVGSFVDKFPELKNICFSGGVALNSVCMGKMLNWFDGKISDYYVTPTPHDGGLVLGAAQHIWHQVLDNPRIKWEDNFTPYLGVQYKDKDIEKAISEKLEENLIITKKTSDDEVVDLLDQQNIIAVFGGGSESGRRALGNRSILADPRSPDMKDIINEKVKHRQWFRPFAPSILREEVKNWFTRDIDSPYMSHVLDFKEEVKEKVPAVVHENGTARLQTVTKNDNEWYHNFISMWNKKSGVPIVLNTSFNDREPICETPEHALNCFLGTEIDYLYFYEEGILVSRK